MTRTRTWALLAAGTTVLVAATAAVLIHRHLEAGRLAPRSPGIRVTVAGGCPYRLGDARDVRNPGAGNADRFVPRAPVTGLICRYGARYGPGGGARYRSVRLGRSDARRLAERLDRIPAGVTRAAHGCGKEIGTDTVLAFGYPHGADADVWYHDSGCPNVDNGTIGADEIAKPAFYAGFAPALDRLAPPCADPRGLCPTPTPR